MSTFSSIIEDEVGSSFSSENIEVLSSTLFTVEDLYDKVKLRDPKIIMIGDGSHGTQEFYHARAEITKKLIQDGLCAGVCIEGDFPDTSQLHFYVTGQHNLSLEECMDGFERFPSWMWCNTSVSDFIHWLYLWNRNQPIHNRCGIFGLDLYSLFLSINQIIQYLNEHDQELCKLVKNDYKCFNSLDPQTYGMLVTKGYIKGCEMACANALKKIFNKTEFYQKMDPRDGKIAIDEAFFNEMNARVVANAEHYYRAIFSTNENSWNIRDTHFFDTLVRVRKHLSVSRGNDRVVVWAHNSHIGNAQYSHLAPVEYTQVQRLKSMKKNYTKDINLGQLCKERYPNDTVLIGQLCNNGVVCAADDWGEQHHFKQINAALPNSYEHIFHTITKKLMKQNSNIALNYCFDFSNPLIHKILHENRLERAIGVIYRPETERQSHYYYCDIVKQFDFLIWFDRTGAVIPIEKDEKASDEMETYPTGV